MLQERKITEIFKTGNNVKYLKQKTIYKTKLLQQCKSWNRLETSSQRLQEIFKGTQPKYKQNSQGY